MYDRRDPDIPRLWRQPAPPGYPEDPFVQPSPRSRSGRKARPSSLRAWLAGLSPVQQLGYGCLGIVLVSATMLYCVGASTFFIRPMLAERAAITPTQVVRPTLVPTPTQVIEPTFIQLPKGTLVATPTQAPIPTREPPTITPTVEVVNGMTVTPQPTATGKASPTRKPGTTVTPTLKP